MPSRRMGGVLSADVPVPGLCHARGVNEGLPAVWRIDLPVGDLAESVRRVEAGGGALVEVSRDDAGERSSAAVQDLVGAYVALVRG